MKTSEKVKNVFLGACDGRVEEFFNRGNAPEYTRVIFDEVLPVMARTLGLGYETEYSIGKIDGIFFEDIVGEKRIHWVLEHENVGDKAHEEIEKLVLLAAPTKVLITYAWDNHENRNNLLAGWAKIVSAVDTCNEVGKSKTLVVVLGAMDPYSSEEIPEKYRVSPDRAWRFYEYQISSFKEV